MGLRSREGRDLATNKSMFRLASPPSASVFILFKEIFHLLKQKIKLALKQLAIEADRQQRWPLSENGLPVYKLSPCDAEKISWFLAFNDLPRHPPSLL
jgi:hypothetical protein